MYYGNNVVPLCYHLTLTEYEIYHEIADTLSFHKVYNLLLKSSG